MMPQGQPMTDYYNVTIRKTEKQVSVAIGGLYSTKFESTRHENDSISFTIQQINPIFKNKLMWMMWCNFYLQDRSCDSCMNI